MTCDSADLAAERLPGIADVYAYDEYDANQSRARLIESALLRCAILVQHAGETGTSAALPQ
jgi:uncharacterized membrane protein YsdA (DUF1294 family)